MRRVMICVLALLLLAVASPSTSPQWQAASGPLATRWAAEVSPGNVLPEYPRPQLVRDQWVNLNGLWEYAIRPREASQPEAFDGQILVPFAVESALSGVMRPVGPENRLWYRRRFERPADGTVRFSDDGTGIASVQGIDNRVLLHFGAIDWHATVWVNGRRVGEHRGGYDPFTFDITDALEVRGEQEIVISVWDPVNEGFQPRGKQVLEPRGIWYTSVTGIWQTVWLESVPPQSIESLKMSPDIDAGTLRLSTQLRDRDGVGATGAFVAEAVSPGLTVNAAVLVGGEVAASASGAAGEPLEIDMPDDFELWSPDSPYLYDLRVELRLWDVVVDSVDSYFGMRKISIEEDEDGFNRLFLNNEPLFQYGTLDQGWWPDGLYTAPTDAALRSDVEVLKSLGFNMTRKHVKVEPARWYYHCDQLGLLVWQDLPNGDAHIGREDPDLERTRESADNYHRELEAMISSFGNQPSIVVWVPFNEGWGQFDTDGVMARVKELDPSRLVDGPSGWTDRGSGDIYDIHRYPGPAMPEPEPVRAVVLGEFGGLGLPIEGHLWRQRDNWGYRTYTSREELKANYDRLIEALLPMVADGLAAAIYTQTTDVEGEVNGLMTYDREVIKFDVEAMHRNHQRLYRAVAPR